MDKLEYLIEGDEAEPENIAQNGDFFFNTRNTLELVGKGATWFGESGKYAMLVTPSNPLPTFRSGDGKESSIDNIIYTSDTMELTKGGVTRSDYSDHFMLYATFKTK